MSLSNVGAWPLGGWSWFGQSGGQPPTLSTIEPLYRWSNWEIQKPSHAFEKTAAQTIEFPVTVAPDGTQTVTYVVEYTW